MGSSSLNRQTHVPLQYWEGFSAATWTQIGKSHQWLFSPHPVEPLHMPSTIIGFWSSHYTQVCFHISLWCVQPEQRGCQGEESAVAHWAEICVCFFNWKITVLSHRLYINMYHLLKFIIGLMMLSLSSLGSCSQKEWGTDAGYQSVKWTDNICCQTQGKRCYIYLYLVSYEIYSYKRCYFLQVNTLSPDRLFFLVGSRLFTLESSSGRKL